MTPACVADYREAARRRLPKVLFDYIEGGSYGETTLAANTGDLAALTLRQRVLRDVSKLSMATEVFGQTLAMPVVLAPVGLGGMYARRGETQAARAAKGAGVPFSLSTVALAGIEEVAENPERVLADSAGVGGIVGNQRQAGVKLGQEVSKQPRVVHSAERSEEVSGLVEKLDEARSRFFRRETFPGVGADMLLHGLGGGRRQLQLVPLAYLQGAHRPERIFGGLLRLCHDEGSAERRQTLAKPYRGVHDPADDLLREPRDLPGGGEVNPHEPLDGGRVPDPREAEALGDGLLKRNGEVVSAIAGE